MPRRTKAAPKRSLRVALPLAALLLAAAVLAAVFLREPIGRIVQQARETKPIGVQIGVSESSPPTAVQNTLTTSPKAFGAAVASQERNAGVSSASQPSVNSGTVSNSPQVSSPELQPTILPGQTSNTQSQAAAARDASEASSPGAIAESSPSSADEMKSSSQPDMASQPYTSGQSAGSQGKKKTVSSASQRRVGSGRAQMVGITSDGRLIYRLPSGRTRVVAPDLDEGEFAPRRHRRVFIDRDEVFVPPPRFAPDYFPDD